MSTISFYIPIIILFLTGMSEGNSRVSFSRPGEMMRIPNSNQSYKQTLFSIGISSEVLSSINNISAISLSTKNPSNYLYGVSFVQPIEPLNSVEFALGPL